MRKDKGKLTLEFFHVHLSSSDYFGSVIYHFPFITILNLLQVLQTHNARSYNKLCGSNVVIGDGF